MNEAVRVSLITGLVLMALYLPLIIVPVKALSFIKAFPRNKLAGWLLSLGYLVSAVIVLRGTSLDWFDPHKQWMYVAAPVMYVLVITFLDELLAARALGAIMLLVPMLILDAVRWEESNFRYVLIVLSYIMVLKGLMFLFNPYKFRKMTERYMNTAQLCRIFGMIGFVLSVVVLLGAWFFNQAPSM